MYIENSYEIYNKELEFLRIISISDIHFGKLDPEKEYNILKEQFLSKISSLDFDILCIAGDLFNHKELANSDTVKYAHLFILKCIDICKKNGSTFIILHGTYEHDANQLKLFHGLITESNCDVRIVENIKFEYVKGFKILCIPEEYGKGANYYLEFLNQSYDICFMHGTYVGSIHGKDKVDLDSRREPTFDMECFKNCRGPILSGHVHTAKCFNKHFYYHGSPIRSQFGEEDEKGFYCCIYNKYNRYYYIHFEEIISDSYNTIYIDNIIDHDIEMIVEYLASIDADYIRVKTSKNHKNLILLKEYYKDNPNVKIDSTFSNVKKNLTDNNISKGLESEYGFIFDKSLNSYDILAKYINKHENENINISGDDIKNILDKLI